MGQNHSINTLPAGPSAIETAELSDLTFERPLGGARFLRTVRARHQHGIVVVKVCAKTSHSVSFKKFADGLKAERRRLKDVPNVLPYQKIRETSSIGVLVRQFIHSSLYDRISIRPFLESIEKKWIAFQLICAVRDCHARGVYHGDIKSENVLVTSWGWVFLTDFASVFKPVYLPEDNPADFSFYYDTSARRTCYLAPERFLAAGEKPSGNAVQWNMDIFSLGCVIAELFTETPTFTLSQLFRFRKGEYDPALFLLNKVDDDHVRALISSMIRLDPEQRWHAQDYLDEYKGTAFPLYFYQHFHTLMQEITDPSSGRKTVTPPDVNNGEADDRIDRIYDDFEMLSVSLGYDKIERTCGNPRPAIGHDLFPLQLDLPNDCHTTTASPLIARDNGTFILLNVITTSLRSTARASSKLRACELLLAFAERLPDETKLDRVVPYVMPLLSDTNEMVLCTALRTMTQILALVNVASQSNSFLFSQFVFPRLQQFITSEGRAFQRYALVRATFAACLAPLAETASRFLDMTQALQTELPPSATKIDTNDGDHGYATYYESYDATRAEALDQLEGLTKVVLTDKDSAVKRAFLASVTTLCVVLGEARASDIILSHLNTYMNEPDWQLRCTFLKTIVGVAVYVGGSNLEDFILPLMLQALTDSQEFVVAQALTSLASMAEIGLLQRAKTWELIDTIARFAMHPNIWIKEAAAHFIAAATTYLSLADTRILVAPLITPFLKVPISDMTEGELLDAMKTPLSRAALDLALSWASEFDRSEFWKHVKDSKQLLYPASGSMPPKSSFAQLSTKALSKVPKTDEDEQWLGRLRNAGMRAEDEIKLLAFREYLWRTAQRTRKDEVSSASSTFEQIVCLTKLKITPQTVIFDNDTDLYHHRMQTNGPRNQDVVEALQEAQDPAIIDGTGSSLANGAVPNGRPMSNESDKAVAERPPRLPNLKRQTSGSGQSLSSSPGSGINPLGKERKSSLQPRSNATRLLKGSDLYNKTLAGVVTDDITAAGKLNPPSVGSRRTSPGHNHSQARQGSSQVYSRAAHNYSGNDPTILKLLDKVYVDGFPSDVAEFGPIVEPLKSGKIPSNSSVASSTPWRPQGQLIAVLGEHTARVTCLIVSPDHVFFVTGGDDGFFRVWDTSRLERNITHQARHKQSIGTDVRVTSLCFINSTHSFVCTGSDGSVHFTKVHVTEGENGPKYGNPQPLRVWQIPSSSGNTEFAIWSEHFRDEAGSTLVLATNLGRIMAVDLRYMSILFELTNPAQHGTPTCFCLSRRHDWLLVGTSHGVLDLWDLRFCLRLRSWAFPDAAPVTHLQLHPSKKSRMRNRVCVSGGTARGEVTVWDIEKGICHEIIRPAHAQSKDRADPRDYELQNLDDERSEGLLSRVIGSIGTDKTTSEPIIAAPASSITSHFSVQQASEDTDTQHTFALTGGPDNKIRFWDCEKLEGCRIISGNGSDSSVGTSDEKPTYTFTSLGLDTRVLSEKLPQSSTVQGVESNKIGSSAKGNKTVSKYETVRSSARSLMGQGHLDMVTAVALVQRPFGMVVSADRSGMVFVHC